MYDIIIIGAGPAGLTAALYARRRNAKVLILEEKSYGGQIINTPKIENYPAIAEISGFDFATNLYHQVKELNPDIKFEKAIKIKDHKVITTKNEYETKAIIIATGVQNKKLGLEKEEELIGRGISYCATCDGSFYKEKVVAVVGGGNTALEDALYLSNVAKKVYLIHRKDSFKAEQKIQEEVKEKENIEIILNKNIIKLIGEDLLEKIELNDNRILDIDGLFIAIGQVPNNSIFQDIIELNQDGYIISSDGIHTSRKGIYVAGDTREKELRQLTTAIADGALAATKALQELE